MRSSSIAILVVLLVCLGCSGGSSSTPEPTGTGTPATGPATATGTGTGTATPTGTGTPTGSGTPSGTDPAAIPADLPRGLLIATSQFRVENGQVTAAPGPARLDIVTRQGGEWRTQTVEDPESNVFHKAMVYQPPGGSPGILTLGAMAASVKLWSPGPNGFTSRTLWTQRFGGRFDRMRDAEVADLFGDGPTIAVATHDQGVVSLIRADGNVQQIDARPNTFVHEIEIGDLNGDGTLEVYATPSDPNDLSAGAEQHGEVVRYTPRTGEGRTVVADLGNRHAKEIYVGDVDGDGRDELYVAVEALTSGSGADIEIREPVEIRRYDADTAPDARVVVATIQDRLTRFLTVGDVDGDGRREMVIAAFRSGLWLARPGRDPRGEWSVENIDRESSGFEHAALLTDLDGDGRDELYVGSDEQGELRRYVWVNGRPRSEVILRREVSRAIMTWNLMPVPVSVLGAPAPAAAP